MNFEPMVTLNFDEAVTLAKRAIAEKGEDYVYSRTSLLFCNNFNEEDGSPSCIVGHILSYKGMAWGALRNRQDAHNEQAGNGVFQAIYNSAGVSTLVNDEVIALDSSKTEDFLSELQNLQDNGAPWGKALNAALAEVEDWGPEDDQ